MNSFPKKYKPQEINNRSKLYKQTHQDSSEINPIFSVYHLPISKKFSYQDFFCMYMKDFENLREEILYKQNNNTEWNKKFENLFVLSDDQFANMWTCYSFFDKRRQTLTQVWNNKLERRILSVERKNLQTNNKILDSYFSRPHKLFMADSEFYFYLLDKFHKLWDEWKITKKSEIVYRSFNLQTSIPSNHITRREEKTPYYTLKYFIWSKCEALPVWLENIDTCRWDVAILVHPKDKRYNKYIGKTAIIPLCNRQIPIFWDENVNITKNNGIKRICPCEDPESIQLAEQYNLPTDIYGFDQQGHYTEYIHEPAFIWQNRNNYYWNIEWYIQDIGNLAKKEEIITKVPYLDSTWERLIPYKTDLISIDIKEEKNIIIQKILNEDLHFSFLNEEFWNFRNRLDELKNELSQLQINNLSTNEAEWISNDHDIQSKAWNHNAEIDKIENQIEEIEKNIIDYINDYLPDSYICNSQLPYWWKLPLIKNNQSTEYFNIEKDCLSRKWDNLQICFDFILLSLIRLGVLWTKEFWMQNTNNSDLKLCEYEKMFVILSQNEKKIQNFVERLKTITWNKKEYQTVLEIIQNLTDETNSSIDECSKLIDNSQFLQQEWNWLTLKLPWTTNEVFDPDFIQNCFTSYLYESWININQQKIINNNERFWTLHDLVLQQIFLWKTIQSQFIECLYNKKNENFWDKDLSPIQIEQIQWNLFNLYWENPVRLNLITNHTYDQKEILLNNIFLKQIWNAIRYCSQNNLLPTDISNTLNQSPDITDELDLTIICKLNELYNDRESIKNAEQYISFFSHFKASTQDLFFSWYLEMQKYTSTKDIQYVCAYFFNFLLTVLYPLIPEYVEALSYVSNREFLHPIIPIKTNKSSDYNMNAFYEIFVHIKHMKLEFDIKQHEYCNIFLKSWPSLSNFLKKYENILKNYFHIDEITYLMLHEQNLLWYDYINDDVISITMWIQHKKIWNEKHIDNIESLEKDLRDLEDKANIIRQRIQLLPDWEQRNNDELKYATIKEEIQNLSIRIQIMNQN